MAMDSALAHLKEANDVGAKTLDKMHAQSAKMEKMQEDMALVNANLDTTEAIIGDMEKGYLQYLVESGLTSIGFDMTTPVNATYVDLSTPSLKEGWLQKRQANYGSSWENQYCALYEAGLLWYDDEEKTEIRGEMEIKKLTKTYPMTKNKAPGDALKHRGEKPNGFVVDVNGGASGLGKRLFYFDAETKPNQNAWVEAIDSVARKMKKKDKLESEDTSGSTSEQINNFLDDLHDQALDMGAEARKQQKMVKNLTATVDSTTERLNAQTARLKEIEAEDD